MDGIGLISKGLGTGSNKFSMSGFQKNGLIQESVRTVLHSLDSNFLNLKKARKVTARQGSQGKHFSRPQFASSE